MARVSLSEFTVLPKHDDCHNYSFVGYQTVYRISAADHENFDIDRKPSSKNEWSDKQYKITRRKLMKDGDAMWVEFLKKIDEHQKES